MQRCIIIGILIAVQIFNGCQPTERAEHMNSEDSKQGMAKMRITTVRLTQENAQKELETFVFGDEYSGFRVPRGIDPELVCDFLRERLTPDSDFEAYKRALEVIRYYESSDIIEHIVTSALTNKEADQLELERSAYAIQAAGDLGTDKQANHAANYFNEVLLSHHESPKIFKLLLETAVVLAPFGSLDRLSSRIERELQMKSKLRMEDEAGMRAYEKVAAIKRNDLPRATKIIEAKKRLSAQPPPDRRAELVSIYLGQSPFSDELMITWAGRLIRQEAMQDEPSPIRADFVRFLDKIDPDKLGDPPLDIMVVRAVQAVLYLQGRLSVKHRELYRKTENRTANFLCDDLPE